MVSAKSARSDSNGVITALDVQRGRLRQELRDLGIADNTMLWFASDNGPERAAPKRNKSNKPKKRARMTGVGNRYTLIQRSPLNDKY